MDVRKIKTASGLEFDCSLAGSPDGVPVLLLHGFGVSRHFWDRQIPALADAGYFAIAPNQRGYSPGARPDPKELDAYQIDSLVGDALDIVAAAGHGDRRFHLVGHDWGGSLSWIIAARHPERLRSLSMLSRPHPASFCARSPCPMESRRGGRGITRPPRARRRPEVVGEQLRMAALAPHASGHARSGDRCPYVCFRQRGRARGGARLVSLPRPAPADRPDQGADALHLGGCRRHGGPYGGRGDGRIHRAPYHFEVLAGVGHYAADQVPDKVNALLLTHLRRHAD